MHPETPLAIIAAFAGFILKTSLGFFVCWVFSKIIAFPGGRFWVWLGFLAGAACYWLWLAVGLAPHGPVLNSAQTPVALALTVPVGRWQVQPSWHIPLSIALRGLGAAYALVLGGSLLARIRKQAHLRWVLRFAYKAPKEIENIFQSSTESQDAGNVRLLVLSGIHSPATFGWIRPTVLLPTFCVEQDSSELTNIFRHELQHVRRCDFVFNAVASLCRVLLFFHPAAWYAMRRLELESELACDMAVVGDSPKQRAAYAECLIRFARLNVPGDRKPWNLDFAGSSVQLKVRVRSLLAGTRKIPGWLLCLRVTLGLLLFAGSLSIMPSLFIVLSYAQHRIARPVTPLLVTARSKAQHLQPPEHRGYILNAPLSVPAAHMSQFVPPNVPENTPAETAEVQALPQGADAAVSIEPGPTLKRRSAQGEMVPQKSDQNTIIRISGQSPTYSGGPGARQGALDSILTTMSNIDHVSHGDKDGH